jgi:hypothetical protein
MKFYFKSQLNFFIKIVTKNSFTMMMNEFILKKFY